MYSNDNLFSDFNQENEEVEIGIEKELICDNNKLLVSEQNQKAYLPYKVFEIQKILESSTTPTTFQEIVESKYILPLNRFKYSSSARFKEAYKLIREKEKGSIYDALDLGFELMFKYNLNPIIIAACRNLDELDIYLDCLDENELHDFDCFEIDFQISPNIVKNNLLKFKK